MKGVRLPNRKFLLSALILLSVQPALGFNAPQPIKHNDILRLTETAVPHSLESTEPGAAPAPGVISPTTEPSTTAGTTGGAATTAGAGTAGDTNTTTGTNTAGNTTTPATILTLRQALNTGLVQSPRVASV